MSARMLGAAALLLATCPSAVAETPAVRLMPLGDSITQWQCGTLGNATSASVSLTEAIAHCTKLPLKLLSDPLCMQAPHNVVK